MADDKPDVKALAWTIASSLLESNHFVTINGSEEVYVFQDGVYAEGGEAYIKRKVQQNLEPTEISQHLVNEVIGHVQRSTYVKPEVFSAAGPKLVLQNGLLDTGTGKLEPLSPDFYSLSKLPVSYVPGQDCPAFKTFISEVLYNEDIPVIQEWFGYCLHRGYPAQVAILFVGEGNNGKSTLISVLKSLLGFENISAVSLQELELNRFAKADLFGKLANLYADLPDSALKGVGTFKMLTGGDPIRGERKFMSSFPFVNRAKLTFSCNVVPEVYEDTTAFFRRWIIIQFPHQFDGPRADKDLLKKLTTAEELSGVLNFALEGLRRLRSNGWTFSNSRSTEEVRLDYIRRSSPMKAFLMDCTSLKSDGVVGKKALFQAFVTYCSKMKLATVTSDTFYKNLPLYFAGHPLQDSKEDVEGNDKRVSCFRGIQLRPEVEWGRPILDEVDEGLKEVDA
ncbi:MAG TPA: phage/plasmid primase, P4 family [Nitrososphaerales archaeon]|nr:phage/plasmid primase, P4 family [Nitrososphaerales archaeon]